MFIEKIVGDLGDKKRYREYKARVKKLPESYRTAAGALERYLTFFGPGAGAAIIRMLNDLADLFEQSVADGMSVRDVVGEDPVEFAEEFLRNYPEGSWVGKERARLAAAIERADDTHNEGRNAS